MTSLTKELRERVGVRAQQVGIHTAMLELREAVDAIAQILAPSDGQWMTDEELDAELEAATEDARAEGHAAGYDEAVRDAGNETVKGAGSRWGV